MEKQRKDIPGSSYPGMRQPGARGGKGSSSVCLEDGSLRCEEFGIGAAAGEPWS